MHFRVCALGFDDLLVLVGFMGLGGVGRKFLVIWGLGCGASFKGFGYY